MGDGTGSELNIRAVSDPYAGPMLSYSLDYESKWWLPVPAEFPTDTDADLPAWTRRVAATTPTSAPWDAEPWAGQLARQLEQQYAELDPGRMVALWYCPYGVPAAGYVQMFALPRDGEADLMAELAGLQSMVAMRPMAVHANGLGDGVGYSRIIGDRDGNAAVAELGYLFAPEQATVAVIARSGDAEMLGMMAPELWELVDTVRLEAR